MRPYLKADLLAVRDKDTRLALERMDSALQEMNRALTISVGSNAGSDQSGAITGTTSDGSAASAKGLSLIGQSYLVVETDPTLINERTISVASPSTVSDGGAKGAYVITAETTRLISATATAGDTLTLTSDGTDLTLTPSRAGGDLIFADPNGASILRLYDATSLGGEGVEVQGPMTIGETGGYTGVGPSENYTLIVERKYSDTGDDMHGVLGLLPTYDADMKQNSIWGQEIALQISDGFDPDAAGGTDILEMMTLKASMQGTVTAPALVGGVTTLAGIYSNINLTIPATSKQWTSMSGVFIANAQLNGVVPVRSYGLLVAGPGNGTTAWAGMFAGDVQISGSNKLRFGGIGVTTQATDTMYRSSAGNLRWQTGGSDRLNLSSSALAPTTNGGITLGADGAAFGSLLLKDTGASFEITQQFTCTGISADRTITVDLGDASRTVTLSGNPTLADWFDQSVKSSSSPTFVSPVVTTAIVPDADGGADVGADGLGFAFVWLADTGSSNQMKIQATCASMTADHTLSIGVDDADRTLQVLGNCQVDQNLTTTAAPQFNRIGVGAAAHASVKLRVDDAVGAPGTNVIAALTNRYGGDTNYCGDPATWLQVHISGTTYKIPCYT